MACLRINAAPSRSACLPMEALPRWKRAMDLTFCVAAFPVLAAATFLVAALMSIASPGPILFRQERVGYMGRRFRLYKFRTMHVGAETSQHQAYFNSLMSSGAPMQKLDAKGDSRLIPLGWLLRATGLDELPQIMNVLRGEMSLIGPRPCIPYEYDNYSTAQRARFKSTPGLTGLWQVSGKNRTTFERMIQLDITYSVERSLKLDLKILFLTIPAVLVQVVDMWTTRHTIRRPQAPTPMPKSGQLELNKEVPTIRLS
jgi:lipopolysaccharide/colanic/teichoic acid biosynthesis glycosyltransferase